MRQTQALAIVIATLLLSPGAMAQGGVDFRTLEMAWESGDYPTALRGFEQVLNSADAGQWAERIAVMTGEAFVTRALTTDGRSVRLSSGAKWLTFERGEVAAPRTIVVRTSDWQVVDSLLGASASVDDAGDRIAVLRAVPGRPARLVVKAIGRGERLLPDSTMLVASPAFGTDGIVYFIGRQTGQAGTQVYAISAGDMSIRALTAGDVQRADLQLLPGGRALLFTVGRDPFAAGGRGGRGGGGGGAAAARDYVVRDLSSGTERAFSGMAAAASADGRTMAFLSRSGSEYVLNVLDLAGSGSPAVVKRSSSRIDAPAVSPDGRQVAFQFMAREDWEIHVIGTDGKGERRLTHEIQHDVLPAWVNANTLLATMGEPRHRRSYLYDATTGSRTRLFHNNTVRTVAPEYEWVISGDGRHVAIVAERDGDTVSPERGVYVTDLTVRVDSAALLERVRSQLRAEVALRDDAKKRFAPLAATIRPLTQSVSKDRIYRYAADLHAFDSKHVSQPGNAKAVAYLDSAYRSFGFEPTLQRFQPGNNPSTANVVATLRGTVSPEVVYVVGSHFDSRAEGPGADDNTSGTTMLLETARVLARTPLPATVMFVSFTGEEAGLLGSREFVRRARADSLQLVGVMNNDMMGWSNDQRLDNTIRYSNPGIRDVQHGAALEFSTLITYDALYYKSTDAAAFYEAYGDIIGGFGSYPILGNPHYHQSHDVLETINFVQVAENTKANVATVMMLAMSPSRVNGLVAERQGSSVSLRWKESPERDIKQYVVTWMDATGQERTARSADPGVTIQNVPAGAVVSVRALNQRGLESWDATRVAVK